MKDALRQFLDSLKTKATRRLYERGIRTFSEWYKKSVEEILEERKSDLTPKPNENIIEAKQRATRFERILEKWHKSLVESGYKPKRKGYTITHQNWQHDYVYGSGADLLIESPHGNPIAVECKNYVKKPYYKPYGWAIVKKEILSRFEGIPNHYRKIVMVTYLSLFPLNFVSELAKSGIHVISLGCLVTRKTFKPLLKQTLARLRGKFLFNNTSYINKVSKTTTLMQYTTNTLTNTLELDDTNIKNDLEIEKPTVLDCLLSVVRYGFRVKDTPNR